MRLVLPYPPSVNHYYLRKRDGNMYIGKRGKEYRLATKIAFIQTGEPPVDGAIILTVHLICPDYRKRDQDNAAGKCLLDALQHAGAIKDDSFIVAQNTYKHRPDAQNPAGQVIVTIERMPDDDVEIKASGAWLV